MRKILAAVGLALMAGCKAEVCCTLEGDLEFVGEATCKERGGADVALYICDGVGDPDNLTDTEGETDDAVRETREELCEDFCAAETTACPTDTLCYKSCTEECPTGPSAADVTCAQDNAEGTCSAFNQAGCWGFCS